MAGSLPLVQEPDRLKLRLKDVPPEPGCYLMRDQNDRILYIGKAKALRNRVRSYFQNSQNHSPRISLMVRQICEIEFIVTDSEAEALALESNLIKQNQPHFNVKTTKNIPIFALLGARPIRESLLPASAAFVALSIVFTAPTWMWASCGAPWPS